MFGGDPPERRQMGRLQQAVYDSRQRRRPLRQTPEEIRQQEEEIRRQREAEIIRLRQQREAERERLALINQISRFDEPSGLGGGVRVRVNPVFNPQQESSSSSSEDSSDESSDYEEILREMRMRREIFPQLPEPISYPVSLEGLLDEDSELTEQEVIEADIQMGRRKPPSYGETE